MNPQGRVGFMGGMGQDNSTSVLIPEEVTQLRITFPTRKDESHSLQGMTILDM